MEKEWFKAIWKNNIKKINDLIDKGIDVNTQDSNNEFTPLILASYNRNIEIVELFLKQSNINITIKDVYNHIFIDYIINNEEKKSFLINYDLQKKILDNQRDDIILFLDKYNLVHPDIKKENPELFKANVWGLI
jgi:ankyrin repeat protein